MSLITYFVFNLACMFEKNLAHHHISKGEKLWKKILNKKREHTFSKQNQGCKYSYIHYLDRYFIYQYFFFYLTSLHILAMLLVTIWNLPTLLFNYFGFWIFKPELSIHPDACTPKTRFSEHGFQTLFVH